MEVFEAQGVWWLPEDPDKKSFGTLLSNEEGEVRLRLFGGLASASFHRSYPTILGTAVKDKKNQAVTLRNCFLSKQLTSGHVLTDGQEFFAHRAYFGVHLTDDSDFVFEVSRVSFSGLAAWAADFSGFSRNGDHFSVAWEHRMPLSGKIPGGTINLGVSCSLSAGQRKKAMTEGVDITLAFSPKISEDELNARIIYPLQNFFTFATDLPNAMIRFAVSREMVPFDFITVIGPTTYADESVADELMPFKMLFSLNDVIDRFEQMINLWLKVSRQYYEALVLYFGGIYRPAGYTDLRFTQMMNVVTLFESAKDGGILTNSPNPLVEDLIRDVSPANAMKLGILLRSHPVISAERALVRLFEENRKEFTPLVTDAGRGADAFFKYAINTLGYTLTREKPDERYAATGEELHWLTEVMSFLIKISVLKELEFSNDEVAEILKRNRQYRYIADTIRPSASWLPR